MESWRMSQVSRKVYTVWADGTVENVIGRGSRIVTPSNEELADAGDCRLNNCVDIRGLGVGYENFISYSYGAKWRRFAAIALVVWASAATAIAIMERSTIRQLQTLTSQEQTANGETSE
jgi:hypothetical protein